MSKKLALMTSITINAVDMSNQFNEIALTTERDEQEVTGFQATHKEYLPGLNDATIEGTVLVDFGATAVDGLLWPLSQTNTPFPVVLKPSNGAVAAGNPSYTMQALLYGFTPIGASVGEAYTSDITFRNADPAGVVRAVA